MPAVSIIVPIYRAEKYLSKCVDSILFQTFSDFELILIDDGSPDNSGTICDEYINKDGRIKVIHQKNYGVSMARNVGLDIATGEYILFVDSDDYLSVDYVAKLCTQFSDLTICGLQIQDEYGNCLSTLKYVEAVYERRTDIDYTELYKRNVLYSPYCKLFSNRIIQSHNIRFPEEISWGEDGMFVADYLQYVDKMVIIDYVGYHYVKYGEENSLSTRVRDDVVDTIDYARTYCIDKMLSISPKHFTGVKAVCTEDAKRNIAYFIRKLLENTILDKNTKTSILKRYMENWLVADIFKNVNSYFAENSVYRIVLPKNSASMIINTYHFEMRKRKIIEWLYMVYGILPEPIKSIYRHMKKVIK